MGLFLTLRLPVLGAQVLQGRTSFAQQELLTQAVVAGELPPADTWPQASPPRNSRPGSDPDAGMDLILSPSAAARIGSDPFWDAPLYRLDRKVDLGRLTGWVGFPGAWGGQFGNELYADHADHAWNPTNLVHPESEEANIFPAERHFVTQAWLWYNFRPLQVELGRDKVHWGPLDHSLIVSDSLPFLDMARVSIEVPHWSLEWILSTPETRVGGTSTEITNMKIVNLHRLEYRADTWRLGVSENYMVSRPGPVVLADLFPVMLEHQADINPNNECVALDVEWVPAPHWRLMGQVGLDDVEAKTFGIPDDDTPTIPAIQVGAEWRGELGKGTVVLHAEGGHTHYLWGNFQEPDGRAEYILVQNDHADTIPMTSPYGPGATWIDVYGQWTSGPTVFRARLEAFSIVDGVTLNLPYQTNSRYDGVGTTINDRFTMSAQWPLSDSWTLGIEESREFHGGVQTFGGRVTLSKHWSTLGAGSAKLAP